MKIPSKYTDFILNYNETFKYMEKKYPRTQVDKYWEYLSGAFLDELRELAKEKGLQGIKQYWDKILSREDAEYSNTIESGKFIRIIKNWYNCPPIRVMQKRGAEVWKDYCDHCKGIYEPVLKRYDFAFKQLKNNKNECIFVISKISPKS